MHGTMNVKVVICVVRLLFVLLYAVFVCKCVLPWMTTEFQLINISYRIILLVVLYGCKTWSLTLREERRQRVYENRVLRRIFVPKRDKVTGEWGKLHNEELNILYVSPNIVRVIKSRKMR
jgi:hypothetical protein